MKRLIIRAYTGTSMPEKEDPWYSKYLYSEDMHSSPGLRYLHFPEWTWVDKKGKGGYLNIKKFKSPNGPLRPTQTDPKGWGGENTSYTDFEKAANATGWGDALMAEASRCGFGSNDLGNYVRMMTTEGDWYFNPYLSDDKLVMWTDNLYKLTPNESRNLNTYLLKYSPKILELSDGYPTPYSNPVIFKYSKFNIPQEEVLSYYDSYRKNLQF